MPPRCGVCTGAPPAPEAARSETAIRRGECWQSSHGSGVIFRLGRSCVNRIESPKFEPAARRWLVRYLTEGTPGLDDVAKVTASLAKRLD